MDDFSDYILYVDESGDHGLASIDPNYPVFVLAFCIFHKEQYASQVVSAVQRFKFKYFGHDMVILHEHDIRKDKGDFKFLKNKEKKDAFLNELTEMVKHAPFTLITTVIKKDLLMARYVKPENPYHIALGFGLERAYRFLQSDGQTDKITHVVFENRGKKEDDDLELEFRRVCDGGNYFSKHLPFRIVFADKKTNSGGLQFADLVARPIGLSILRPSQSNRAFEALKSKFYCDRRGKIDGWGLKCFP
ncbi:MAG: DUF3800 domain-containing protein [Deltaproteobacteria bacterium]|nr:DUF3800 domain-containing protein [Deltaproteobacteria bacterium]